MEQDDFVTMLNQEGFAEIATVVREPHGGIGLHRHDFDAKALVLKGEIRVLINEVEFTYREGDVFHLKAGLPHAESYGPDGVKYLVGRRGTTASLPAERQAECRRDHRSVGDAAANLL